MGQPRLNFGVDIGLNLRPFFSLFGWLLGDLMTEVPGFDSRENALGRESIKVVDY